MKKNDKKNNKGNAFIKLVLIIFIIILVVILGYEIIYEDILNENKLEIQSSSVSNNIFQLSGETENYSNHYYYDQLDEVGKIFYQGLEQNRENLKSGTYEIDFGTEFSNMLNEPDGDGKLKIAFQSAWNAFTYDYVDIFYIDITKLVLTTKTVSILGFATHKVNLSNRYNENYFESNILSEEDVRQKCTYIENARKRIISNIKGYSDYEKVKYIHDWMVDNFEYDYVSQNEDIYNVYGALANKKVVCEGYGRAYKYLLDGLGIENVLISGKATNSSGSTENHAWNYVKLNGKWYAVDVTWDDPIIKGGGKLTKELKYKNFLKGSNSFFSNHKEIGELSQNSIVYKFPTLERSDYN